MAEELTTRLAGQTGLHAHTVVTGTPVALPAPAEATLLRVLQEALANVRQHAQAAQVTVTLSYLPDMLMLDIQDDGTGFPTDNPPAGVGLGSMTERVTALGGRLTVESTPGQGTTIAAQIPATPGPHLTLVR